MQPLVFSTTPLPFPPSPPQPRWAPVPGALRRLLGVEEPASILAAAGDYEPCTPGVECVEVECAPDDADPACHDRQQAATDDEADAAAVLSSASYAPCRPGDRCIEVPLPPPESGVRSL